MITRRARGPARPQAADAPDRDRDRARRRDGQRHVRPHRLDRQGVQLDLHRRPQGLGRRRHAASRRSTSRRTSGSSAPTIDESLLAKVRALPGRRGGRGQRRRRRAADRIRTARRSSSAARRTSASASRTAHSPLQPADARRRRLAARQRGRDRQAARPTKKHFARRRHDRRPGRRARSQQLKISGLVKFGSARRLGGATLAGFDLPTAQRLFDKQGQLDEIAIAGEARRRPTRSSLQRGARDPAADRAGADRRRSRRRRTRRTPNSFISFLRGFLLAFGGIALFVGSFVIANSLSITIAQRTREFATHAHARRDAGARCCASIVVEALVIGDARVGRRAVPRPRPREGALQALRRGRLHAAEQRPHLRDAHDRSSRCSSAIARHADREPAARRSARRACRRSPRCARARRCRRRASRASAPSGSAIAHGARVRRAPLRAVRQRPRHDGRPRLDGLGALLIFVGVALLSVRFVRPLAGRARLAGDEDRRRRRLRSRATTRGATRSAPPRPRPR